MEYEKVKHELEKSSTLKLIRNRNAALIISFLHKQFKVNQKVSITQADLETRLGDYLDFLQDIDPDSFPMSSEVVKGKSPKDYLKIWCDDQLLRKTFDDSDSPVFTLTSAAEKAIDWLENLQQREDFVGTESRFLQIFSLLKEIQDRSTIDVETRIAQLEKDRDQIQQEIDHIRQTGIVERYNETQLQERFLHANQVTRELIADFKDVEQNFRNLTRTVQEAQLQQDNRRGTIVSRVLDADQELKNSPQGHSFYTFWNFLISDSKQQELEFLIQAVYQLDELKPLTKEYGLLRRIKRSLLDAGQYIVQSNHRLTEKLRQMLDVGNLQENRRVTELINDVLRLALQINSNTAIEQDFWVLEDKPNINLVMDRPLHRLEESEVPTFSFDFSELPDIVLEEGMAELYQQFYIDEEELIRKITSALQQRSTISLMELIQLYPVTQGLSELVAYLAIATQSAHHVVNTSTIDETIITSLDPEKQFRLTLPQIIFHH